MIDNIITTDPGKNAVLTGRNDKLLNFYQYNLQYTKLGKFIIFRLRENRDVKMLITGSGKTTGTGKTTLAILLAHFVSWVQSQLFDKQSEWSAYEYSFLDVWDYLKKYKEADAGDPLISDELEYMADRRNAMTTSNKKFSQAWSVLRWKNVVTIGTAPGLSDLEKRLPEGADIWLNVIHKGKANPYYLTQEDFPPWRPIYKRLRYGRFKESILWNPLDDSDDYRHLEEKKREIGVPGIDDMQQVDESDLNSLESSLKRDYLESTLKFIDRKDMWEYVTQTEIAEICSVSQPQVSKVKRELEKADEL